MKNNMTKRDLADIFSSTQDNKKENNVKTNVAPSYEKNNLSYENISFGTLENKKSSNTNNIANYKQNTNANCNSNRRNNNMFYEKCKKEKETNNNFHEFIKQDETRNIENPYISHIPNNFNNNSSNTKDLSNARLSNVFPIYEATGDQEKKANIENFKRENNFMNDEKIKNISTNYNISINLLNNNHNVSNIHNTSSLDDREMKMKNEPKNNTQCDDLNQINKIEENKREGFDTYPINNEELKNKTGSYIFNVNQQNAIINDPNSYPVSNTIENWINNSSNMMISQGCNYLNKNYTNVSGVNNMENITMKDKFYNDNSEKYDMTEISPLVTTGNKSVVSTDQKINFDKLEMKNYSGNRKIENITNANFDINNYSVLNNVQNIKVNNASFKDNSMDVEQNKNSINIIFNNTSINNKYINGTNVDDVYLNNMQNVQLTETKSVNSSASKNYNPENCNLSPINVDNSSFQQQTTNTVKCMIRPPPFRGKALFTERNNCKVAEQAMHNEVGVSNSCTSPYGRASQVVSSNTESAEIVHGSFASNQWNNTSGNYVNHLRNYQDNTTTTTVNNPPSNESIDPLGKQNGMYGHRPFDQSRVNAMTSQNVSSNYTNQNIAHKDVFQGSFNIPSSSGVYSSSYMSNYSPNFNSNYAGVCASSHKSYVPDGDNRTTDKKTGSGRLDTMTPFARREVTKKEEELLKREEYQQEEDEDDEDEDDDNEEEDRNVSSAKDSSSEENYSDDNSSSEKREIYTLIKKTYNRIDMNKIPRPITHVQEKKNRRNVKIFETCKYISPPSCYQPVISIDTGKANPKFLRSSLYQIPLFSETLKLAKVPFGVILNPFASVNEKEKVDKVDMKEVINDKEENIEILRCPKCYGYLNATMLENISKSQNCVFCDNTFFINENVLFDIYQYNDKANPRWAKSGNNYYDSISPLLKGSVDLFLPPLYFNNNNTLKLAYTYMNKSVNQAAALISNKIKSITKQFSSTLDNYDIINTNKNKANRILNDASASLATKGSTTSENVIETENDEDVNSNANLYINFKKMKELLNEKKGEPLQVKMKRNDLLNMYPQMKKCLPPYFVFVVECSYNALHSNITHTVLEGIRYAVKNVKCDKTKIAIITFNRDVHFYHCKNIRDGSYGKNNNINNDNSDINNSKVGECGSGNNQMFVMSAVDDPFIPLPFDDLFFSCIEEFDKINNLIDFIKSVTINMQVCNSCGNCALKVAVDMLKERNGGGSVCMFYSSTPNYGLGAITEIKKNLNEHFAEVKEKIFFDSILLDLYSYNISVDTFFIKPNSTLICLPSLQYLAQNTGGKILYIEDFIWQRDYKEVYMNIEDTLTSEDTAYYCELKLRHTQYISIKNLFCCNNNFNSIISVDTIKIPKIRSDQTFSFLFNYFDMLETKKRLYIQCACLYTNLYGERFVRLHTTHVNLTASLSTVFRYTDAEALMSLLIKQLCTNIMLNNNYVKIIIDNLADILFSYRVNCAASAHGGQLILPDTLKLLPLFVSCLLKHNVVKKDILSDLKIYNLIKLMSLPVISSLIYVYPILYLIHVKGRNNEIDTMDLNDEYFIPKTIPTSAEKIYSNGVYLLDAATHFYLYFGFHSDAIFAQEILGQVPTEENAHELSLINSISAQKMQRIIWNISNIYHQNKYIPLVIVPAKSAGESRLISLCVEDMIGKEYSYVNFLCFIHKLVHRKIDES